MSSDKTTASRPPASSPPERRMVAVFTISHEGSFIQKRSLRRKASFRARRPTKESVRAAREHHHGKMVLVLMNRTALAANGERVEPSSLIAGQLAKTHLHSSECGFHLALTVSGTYESHLELAGREVDALLQHEMKEPGVSLSVGI